MPLYFNVSFWAVALLASLFHGWKVFDIFTINAAGKPWSWKLHQRWFNFAGSFVGWAASWLVLRRLWHCLATSYCPQSRWSDAALCMIAFVGITGFLPFATVGALESIKELAKKVPGVGG